MIRIECKKRVWSQNESAKAHWATRLKEKKDWRRLICALCLVNGPCKKPTGKRHVSVVSYRCKLLDIPNLWGGLKETFDALVDLHLIADDRPEFAEFTVRQEQCRKDQERTVIDITGEET